MPGRKGKSITDVRSAARSYTELALHTLVGICKTGKQESAKAAAAQALLDRGWGKPKQPVGGEGEGQPLEVIQRVILGTQDRDR